LAAAAILNVGISVLNDHVFFPRIDKALVNSLEPKFDIGTRFDIKDLLKKGRVELSADDVSHIGRGKTDLDLSLSYKGNQAHASLDFTDRQLDAVITKDGIAASVSDVKILLYLSGRSSRDKGFEVFDLESIKESDMLTESFSDEEISHALNFWSAVGIFSSTEAQPSPSLKVSPSKEASETEKSGKVRFDREKKPSYTSAELAKAVEKKEFSALLEYTESRLNKMLNPSELAVLFSFCDHLAFSPEVIMLATEHCISEGKRSLRYIEKLLLDFADKDIRTYEGAEEYVNNRKRYKSVEGKVRSLCGMGERSLTKSEKTIIGQWASDPKFDLELLKEAYDLTINAIGKPTLSYINSILIRWMNEGIDSLEKLKNSQSTQKEDGSAVKKTYDLEDFFKAAVEKERK